MTKWISIVLGAFCIAWTLVQLRILQIFVRNRHTTTNAHLAGTAQTLISGTIRSVLTAATLSLIFLLVPWPGSLVYVALTLVVRAVIDLFFFWQSAGIFSFYAPGEVFGDARSYTLGKEIVKAALYVAALVLCVLFLRNR
jgi:hypothetical protein